MSNALKFTNYEAGIVELKIKRFDANLIEIKVKDNGIGLTKENAEKLGNVLFPNIKNERNN